MIEIVENSYDFYTSTARKYPLFDILVDKTRIATRRNRQLAYKLKNEIELELGYKCSRGTQMDNFKRYYHIKYENKDINC